MRLGDATIRTIEAPSKGQKLYRDSSLPGFGCRVSCGGTKTFVLVRGNDRRMITIGRYPVLSLSEARAEAKKLLAEFTLGKTRPQSITYQAAGQLFLEDKAINRRPSTVYGYKLKLRRFGYKGQLGDITYEEAARRVNRVTAPSERSHVLVAMKVFFNWCIKRRYITENPLMGVSKAKSRPRERILSDDEIRAIWNVTSPYADYVKLLLLTAQRRGELRRATVTTNTLTIAADISKNNRATTIPFTATAHKLWRPFPEFHWSLEKVELDKLTGLTGWTLHDCRRTAATRLAELGTAPHVIERILNHITGQISGVSAIYNRATYQNEMREALEKLETHLVSLCAVATDPGKALQLPCPSVMTG